MDKAKVYIKENKERFISELFDLLRVVTLHSFQDIPFYGGIHIPLAMDDHIPTW